MAYSSSYQDPYDPLHYNYHPNQSRAAMQMRPSSQPAYTPISNTTGPPSGPTTPSYNASQGIGDNNNGDFFSQAQQYRRNRRDSNAMDQYATVPPQYHHYSDPYQQQQQHQRSSIISNHSAHSLNGSHSAHHSGIDLAGGAVGGGGGAPAAAAAAPPPPATDRRASSYSNNSNSNSNSQHNQTPLNSPGFSSSFGSPTTPGSAALAAAVPLLYSNNGHPTSGTGGGGGGGGGGGYNTAYDPAPPPLTSSMSSPSIKNSGGAGMFKQAGVSSLTSPTSPFSDKSKGYFRNKSKRDSGSIAQKRLSSFKHTEQDYYNNPKIRAAYLSPTTHFFSIWVPFAGFLIILGGIWGLTIATQVRHDHMLEVDSAGFYDFGITYPTLLVAAYTFISSLLNAFLLWCFSCAILSYARYRLSLGRPISLRGLSALSSAQGGTFAFHPLGSKWMWLCIFCWGTFLSTTTGFNTIILPTRRTVSQDISARELDMTSPSFAAFYAQNAPTYYDCGRWTKVRGLMVSPCPAGTAFTATAYAGKAQFESKQLGELTYIRLGTITYTGATWGTLPFTSYNPGDSNGIPVGLPRHPAPNQNFSIALNTQGLRARIACTEVASSPLSMDANVTAPLACNLNTPTTTLSPDLRMRAGYCNTTSANQLTDGPSYQLYMRFANSYIHRDADGTPHNENITCAVTPFVTLENADFRSFDNSTWVQQVNQPPSVASLGAYPEALLERIMNNLVDMMVVFGQNSVDNLMAEQFVQITTAYFGGNYTMWPLVAQRQLEGMFGYLASHERILAEDLTQNDAKLANPTIARITRTGTLQHDTFAYAVDYPTYLLLIPITCACFLGMFLLIKSASFRHVPRFDPLNITSLVVAASATSHDLYLDDAATNGASPDDEAANKAHVAFVRDDHSGQWGFERVQS